MELKSLYIKLREAYSPENLNRIAGNLIILHKNKNYSKIRELANRISKYVSIEEEKGAKCFSRLVILYHPDKGEQYRKALKEHFVAGEKEKLDSYSHILLLEDIDEVDVCYIDDDIDYDPDFIWDEPDSNSYSFVGSDGEEEEEPQYYDYAKNFYNAVKVRLYGDIDQDFPLYYLHDFEEYEMSEAQIESLYGVEHCIHVKALDLSGNEISDLTELAKLDKIEELYLANNQIGYIDILCFLNRLRVLDLSGNQVDDISPLFNLTGLEYVNLIGNPIKKSQIKTLQDKGVMVLI